MTLRTRWQQLLGIRPDEGRTVGLFFLHNFLLGIGTILVYVSANVLLLEHNPARNLPLAYGAAALALLVAGRLYAHYEHRLPLPRLAVRGLQAAVLLTAVVGGLVVAGHSVGAAVAIMAGYRVIYLLTNLEFWGVSAVVFDVRQGKRLFSVISSGDMPAKALGAVLAILIHHHTDVLWLLLTAFGAYVGALFTLRATFRSHVVEARPAGRGQRQQAVAPGLQRWFGSSRLVLTLCLSMLAVAAVSAGIEYSFFVNVKHRFHDQAEVTRFVGTVLALTYLLALVFKLLLSGAVLDRLGVRRTLLALPVLMLAGLALYAVLGQGEAGSRLLYFCGLYLGLEVLRRAVFDPVFLVLFQPLSPPERLQAHTLVKGLYEPLGLGLAAVLLYALHGRPALSQEVTFGWMLALMGLALLLLYRTYGHYLAELQHALSRRFTPAAAEAASPEVPAAPVVEEPAAPAEAPDIPALIRALADKTQRAAATDHLLRLGEAALPHLTQALSAATDEAIIRRVALLCGHVAQPASRQALVALARQPQLGRREAALRALRNFAPERAAAPLFQELVQEEMRRAQLLLHGQHTTASPDLRSALDYELSRVQQRLFGLLLQLYSPPAVLDAQRGVTHAARERQANALEILDNLIPRAVYQGLQALLEVRPLADKVRTFDRLLGGPLTLSEPIETTIIRSGEAAFSDWTISLALRHAATMKGVLGQLVQLLQSTSPLVREGAAQALARLAHDHPARYQHLLTAHPHLADTLMHHAAAASRISATERVALLKHTSLFAETPENVLSSIVPIMKEVSFPDGQQIFAKGDLGTSLFVVYEGEVGIFSGPQQLATFGPGDFFGELALLDTEPRSASAVAHGPVTAFRLDQDDFYDVMEERSEVLRNILRVLCQRLRRQNEKMVS